MDQHGSKIYYQPLPSFIGHNWNSAIHYAVLEVMARANTSSSAAGLHDMLNKCFTLPTQAGACLHGTGHGLGQLALRNLGLVDSVCARFRPKSRFGVLSSLANQRSYLRQGLAVLQKQHESLRSVIAEGFFEHFFMLANADPASWWQTCAAINQSAISTSCFSQGLQWVGMMAFRNSSSRLAYRDELLGVLGAESPDFLKRTNEDLAASTFDYLHLQTRSFVPLILGMWTVENHHH